MQSGVSESSPEVMIISEDTAMAALWRFVLEQNGMRALLVVDCRAALERWVDEIPDLVLLDMPAASLAECLDFCSGLSKVSLAPILLFFPVYHEEELLQAYQLGVDECLVKPVSPAVVAAKVKAWLRRTWMVPVNGLAKVSSARITLDANQRSVILADGRRVRLTNLEFRLLHLLMSQPGTVFSTRQIVKSVWGSYGEGDGTLLKNVVYRLRRKIEEDAAHPCLLKNWPGEGYSFATG